jgi:hypothetical protein
MSRPLAYECPGAEASDERAPLGLGAWAKELRSFHFLDLKEA